MSLGMCFKKLYLVKVGVFAWYSVKIALFSVSELKDEKLIKKQTYMNTEICKLYSRVFGIFLPNIIKIDPYNIELYCFKLGAFFETQGRPSYDTIRYDREFNVDSKAECDQLNLAHETKTSKRQCPLSGVQVTN